MKIDHGSTTSGMWGKAIRMTQSDARRLRGVEFPEHMSHYELATILAKAVREFGDGEHWAIQFSKIDIRISDYHGQPRVSVHTVIDGLDTEVFRCRLDTWRGTNPDGMPETIYPQMEAGINTAPDLWLPDVIDAIAWKRGQQLSRSQRLNGVRLMTEEEAAEEAARIGAYDAHLERQQRYD